MYKITIQFDSFHVCSVWVDGYETDGLTISGWMGHKTNTMFVCFCDDNRRTYTVYQGDVCVSRSMNA